MDLIVSGNGSTIIKDNQVIEKNTISSIATKTIIDYLDKNNIPITILIAKEMFTFNKFPEGLLEEFYRGNLSEFVFKEYEDEKLLNILAYFLMKNKRRN